MTIELSPLCDTCNNPLTVKTQNYDQRKELFRIYIAPCEKCKEQTRAEGRVEGAESLEEPLRAADVL